MLFVGVLPCLAVLRCCELFVWKIEHQESTVLSFSFFCCNHRCGQGGNGTIPPKFLIYLVIVCFDRQCPNKIPLLALSHAIWPPKKNFGLATLLLVTTFIQTACISLAPILVLQYYSGFTTSSSIISLLGNTSLTTVAGRLCYVLPTKQLVTPSWLQTIISAAMQFRRSLFLTSVSGMSCRNFPPSLKTFTSTNHANIRLSITFPLRAGRGTPKALSPRLWPMRKSVTDYSAA